VPPEQSRAFARGRPGVVLDLVGGAGHFAVIDPTSAAWPRVLAAVEQLTGAVERPSRGLTTLA
jgi:hypothetical protein